MPPPSPPPYNAKGHLSRHTRKAKLCLKYDTEIV